MGAASELAYERANLVKNVSMFKNVQFMLVHGTADGNFLCYFERLQSKVLLAMIFMKALTAQSEMLWGRI